MISWNNECIKSWLIGDENKTKLFFTYKAVTILEWWVEKIQKIITTLLY